MHYASAFCIVHYALLQHLCISKSISTTSPFFFAIAIDKTIEPFIHHDDAVFIDELNTHTIKTIIHEMQQPQIHAGVFFHPDLEKLKKAFFKKFTMIQAAGGLVTNEQR